MSIVSKRVFTAWALSLTASAALATASVGQPAPAFSVVDTSGKTVSLSDFKGKHVVLEWVNPGCPFVVKHYGGNMQATQSAATAKGVVWLAVNSTATDSRDFRDAAKMAGWMREQKAAASATLMDTDGKVGRAAGTVVYAGAIDSIASANPADIPKATNHINAALAESLAGKPVSVASTRPYGCSVKYSSM
jgi:hypothetical protein